jgi:hypothetical protein
VYIYKYIYIDEIYIYKKKHFKIIKEENKRIKRWREEYKGKKKKKINKYRPYICTYVFCGYSIVTSHSNCAFSLLRPEGSSGGGGCTSMRCIQELIRLILILLRKVK